MADDTHAEDSAVTSQSPNTTYAQEPTKSTDLQTPVPTGEGSGAVSVRLSDHDDFVLEGGSIESDGKGTVFTTEGCLMAPHRNQPLTRDEIEQELRFRLKAKRIVWLHHGALKGDDTDGHIDTIVRIAPDDTLLYHKCYDSGDEQYEDFQALEQELMSLRTIDGKPYRLIPLPQPVAIYQTVTDDDGLETTERLPATYANFLIINGAVIVPTYGQPELDDAACNAIRDAFPDREIIPIDSRSIIRQHGSIHCCTMQIPLTTYTGGN
jgi:agmatine/peptidylarginine deiminase